MNNQKKESSFFSRALIWLGKNLFVIFLPIVLLIIMLLPDFGIAANWDLIIKKPLVGAIIACIWGVLFALCLPFSRVQYAVISSLLVISVIVVINVLYVKDMNGIVWSFNIGGVLGWGAMSTRVWKAYKHQIAVDDPDS